MKTRKEKISIIVCIAVTLLLIAALVFAVVRKNTDKPDTPAVNSETSDVTDTSDPSDTSDTTDTSATPSVPTIDPGTSGGDDTSTDDTTGGQEELDIDVNKPDGSPKPSEPYVEGEIIVIPGFKEE